MSDCSVTPWTVARQALLSLGFPRQEYWSELPFSSPGDLPKPGTKPGSPTLAGGFCYHLATWEALLRAVLDAEAKLCCVNQSASFVVWQYTGEVGADFILKQPCIREVYAMMC